MRVGLISVLVGVLLAGCSGVDLNDGQVRIAASNQPSGGAVDQGIFRQYLPTSPGLSTQIMPGEDFHITLVSAYICNFREFEPINSLLDFSNDGSAKCGGDSVFQSEVSRGEIAMLAGFGFRDENAKTAEDDGERLVYFSDDVRESGQLLNLLNLSVYGPAPYKKASSRLSLTIMELDQAEVEQQAGFLKTIAAAGQSFASPLQGPVLNVLGSIGEAFIKSNKDDRELAFVMEFDPIFEGKNGKQSNVFRLPIREGYLVVIRHEKRSETNHFDNIKVCPEIGLITNKSGCKQNEYYQDNTWLLLRISREDKDVADAKLTGTLQELLQSRSGLLDTSSLEKIFNALTELNKPAEQ